MSAGSSRTWIYTEDSIYYLDDEVKTYWKVEIPEELRTTDETRCTLPALFFTDARETKRQFTLSLLRETGDNVVLSAIPVKERAAYVFDWKNFVRRPFAVENYQRAAFKLDKTFARPTHVALRFADQFQVIYTFDRLLFKNDDAEEPGSSNLKEPVFTIEMLQGYRNISE